MSSRICGIAAIVVLAAWQGGVVRSEGPAAERPAGATLEQQLLREDAAALARDVRQRGDAIRGAILFHKPDLGCIKCHAAPGEHEPAANPQPAGKSGPLGPDLARLPEKVSDEYLLDSILQPSKFIRREFSTVGIVTTDGVAISGLLVEDTAEAVVLRDAGQDFQPRKIPRPQIEQLAAQPNSIMPTGLVNQLASRQQFLDLARYVLEVAEHGPSRAKELQPAAALFAALPLPEYEHDLDHAGLIAALDKESLKRGEALYHRTCVNCHGTHDRPGSLPTSLAFASGQFKRGGDPYSMYQTLTHGFGLMAPQLWMVPRQKYDVIHYVREALVRPHNPAQYTVVDQEYLRKLPPGKSRGPAPSSVEPWVQMDYGSSLINTYEIGGDGGNFAYKGIAVRLDPGPGGVSRGTYWMIFDHDTLRVAAAWHARGDDAGARFIDWNGIHFNGRHEIHPRIVGQVQLANPTGPGWANPADGGFADPRLQGRDGRRYGPLPKSWGRYCGLYHFGEKVILAYTVGETSVLEMPGVQMAERAPIFSRTFNFGPRARPLVLQVCQLPGKPEIRIFTAPAGAGKPGGPGQSMFFGVAGQQGLAAGLSPFVAGARWSSRDGRLLLEIPAGHKPLRCTLWFAGTPSPAEAQTLAAAVRPEGMAMDLAPLTRGGAARFPERLRAAIQPGDDAGPFAVDVLAHPANNPWSCQMRFSGLDFYPDGRRAAICTWDGDVWLVDGLDHPGGQPGELTWRRIASGLFQPLGLKIVAGKVYVICRDQLAILRDLDGDEEIDFVENFNNDHQVTDHFHEFAMDLQTDTEGNFYYAKAARHAKTALVPQHGTLLRVSKDGQRTDILATGFRAPNGVCLNPDGTFFLSDQEGHWIPKNRINHVRAGGFYGNMWGYHDVTDSSDSAMQQPLCWITNAFDRSPSELLWVPQDCLGPLQGALLNLSYGYGKVFVVPHEVVAGQAQGGMCALPIPNFPTGVMRGRFHPTDGQLYLCGMTAWASSQPLPGGFYRLRSTGKPAYLPIGLQATRQGMQVQFTGDLDRDAAQDPGNYAVKVWSLKRSGNYGSPHVNERSMKVLAARLAADRRTVELELENMQPTPCMEISYRLRSADGKSFEGMIHNTVHRLPE